MKKINTFIITVLLIALLTNPVFGYEGMAGNISLATTGNITQNDQNSIDLANTTQSDQNIILLRHLIEVDAVQFESQNRIYVRETLIFKNIGDKHFSGTLRTWVPDGIEGIKVGKVAMMMDSSGEPLNAIQNGNIISWQGNITLNDPLPPLYAVEYVLSAEPEGTLIKSRHYTKKFVFPTLINKVPLNIILRVTKGNDETVIIKDEKGSNIQSSGKPMDEDNSVLYNWETPQFKEIKIEFSKSAIDLSQMALYLIIGLLIVLVLAYPIIRKKSPKLQEMEEKIRNSLKREPESEEQQETDEELYGKPKDELEAEKNELVSRLEKLEKDYASGDLIDEEYEELRNSYQEKLKKIERKIE
ncbi:hypothetical protein ig2599ANME_1208 [groundwater metagenome]